MQFIWSVLKKKRKQILTNRCLNVRSATANKKKNKNVKLNLNIKPVMRTIVSHVVSPNVNSINVSMGDVEVFAVNANGMSIKLNSVEFDAFMVA